MWPNDLFRWGARGPAPNPSNLAPCLLTQTVLLDPPGLPALEQAGRHAGQQQPLGGGRGRLQDSPGTAAWLHPQPLQPGHQLRQLGRTPVS